MKNIALLSGMNGTGILFQPLLPLIKDKCDSWIYDLNAEDNQQIDYQVQSIEQQIRDKFGEKPVDIVAESYSRLLAYQLLVNQQINISHVYFVGGFLACPSALAKFGPLLNPNWAKIVPDNVLGFMVFNRWPTNQLVDLFRQVLEKIGNPKIQPLFYQRLKNIAQSKAPNFEILIPCTYLQASHDNLVDKSNVRIFKKLFRNLKVEKVIGTHFLIQTNPQKVAEIIFRNPKENMK